MWLSGCTFCVLSSPFLQHSCSPHPQSPLRTALPFTPLGSTHLIICCSVSNKRKNYCIHFKLVNMSNSFVISVFDSIVILRLSRKEHQQMEMFPIYYIFFKFCLECAVKIICHPHSVTTQKTRTFSPT
jgi:hypothetical protein